MYIAFEGLDGCGKTTQIDLLKAYHFKNVSFVREPFYFNKEIRKCLLDVNYTNPAAHTLLFLACHAEAVSRWPKTTHVISDRSIYSSLAYTFGYNANLCEKTKNILRMLNMDNYPQIVFYLKMPVTEMERRFKWRNQGKNNIETKDENYFKRVNKFYNYIEDNVELRYTKWITLDARLKPKDIHTKVMSYLAKEVL